MVCCIDVEAPNLSFGFVDDGDLRSVLEEYYSQAVRAAAGRLLLGGDRGLRFCRGGTADLGAAAEARRSTPVREAPKDKQGDALPVERWGLAQLIDVSADFGMIGKTAKQAAWALKDFRNFIHQHNVLMQSARPDAPLAMSALAAVAEIRRSLEGHLTK